MKQLYRILLVFLLAVFMIDVVHAQSEDTRIIDRTQIDTCKSFLDGKYFLQWGIGCYQVDWLFASYVDLKLAISSFEQHLMEHPENDSAICYLRDTYSLLLKVSYDLKSDENTLLKLHYFYGCYLLMGDSLSAIQPDYCKAFDEFNKAIACIDDLNLSTDLLPIYKDIYYKHACLLFDSYYYHDISVPDTITYCNEIVEQPDWISCIGEQRLDRCIDDLNHIICIEQDDSLKTNIDTLALVLLGKCHYYKNEYQKAIDCFEKSGISSAQLLEMSDYLSIAFFLDSYYKQGIEENEHVTDLTDALFEFWRNNYRLMYMDKYNYKDKRGVMSELAHAIMLYYYTEEKYEKALDFWFKIKNNFSLDDTLLCYQGLCRFDLGDTSATAELEFASQLNPFFGLAHYGLTLSTLSKGELPSNLPIGVALDFVDTTTYYQLGGLVWYYQKNYERAREYYSRLDSKDTDNLLMLAICFQKLSEEINDSEKKERYMARSEKCFRDIVGIEDSLGLYSSSPYAYLWLGEYDHAVKNMEHILRTNLPSSIYSRDSLPCRDDSLKCWEIYFQAAEIYAQVNEPRKAERYLHKAFEYCHIPISFAIAQKAPLLVPIKDYVEQEISHYKKLQVFSESPIHRDTIVCDIPFFRKIDNTKTVNCTINGIDVSDILYDPGANYVQLPKAEADKIGGLYDVGWTRTRDANGNYVCQKVVSLDTLRIGDIVLENVQATINEEPGAQLILGCTVWNNLKVEMPSPANKGMIRLTYIKESIEIPEY